MIRQRNVKYTTCTTTCNFANDVSFHFISLHSEPDSDATGTPSTKCKDISPEWPGLTMDILYDIFGVHKALAFGRQQRADYLPTDFINDIQTAEKKVFGDNICTQHVSKEDAPFALTFYPKYLINDDLFEIMACHYAVSAVVRSTSTQMNEMKSLQIRSVVIPTAICSRYDVAVQFQQTLANLDEYVRDIATSDIYASRNIDADISNICDIVEVIQRLISHLRNNKMSHNVIVIIFHRQRAADRSRTGISLFGCDDVSKLEKFRQNYFLSFDFHVSRARVISKGHGETMTGCWMHFGVGQKLRFYPEYAVWIIPHLFVRSTRLTAHQFLERIYSEHYKHGWRVSLDDPIFNKYYHIITQHEHISNNYNRNEVEATQRGVQQLLRDVLERKLRRETAVKLNKHVGAQAYDSEAILEDMEDVNDSNFASFGGFDDEEFCILKFAVLAFQNMHCTESSVRDLNDCEHIHILIENLRKFQNCGLVVDTLNVVQFEVDSVIAAFDHIIKAHGFLSNDEEKVKIQNYVADHVTCPHGSECCVLKEHGQRTREREKTEEKKTEPVHEVDTLCEVTAEALYSAHCYVVHRETDLYRLQSGRENEISSRFGTATGDDDQIEDVEDMKDVQDGVEEPMQFQGINFGVNVLQWLPFGEEPQFGALGEEMIRNPDSTIDAHIFQQYLMICLAKIKDTNYTVNEMVSLKFYTDTNEMQSQLRKAHWTAATLKVRKSYYQWAMGLYRAHLYHDKPIPVASGSTSKPCRLWHGLNQLFTVSREMPVYFGPISTTIAKSVASTFCNNQGLIWLIQSSYANPLKLVVGINVDWISGFKHEREVLLYNQCLPIEKTETFDDDSNILMNHFIRSLISRESPIIKKDAFYKQLGVGLDAKWMHSICDHDLIFESTECSNLRVVDRLVLELGVVEPDMMVKLWNTKHGDKSELEYLVEDKNANKLQHHYRVKTSKFNMLHFSPLLNRSWLKFIGDINDDCIKQNEYKTATGKFDATTSFVKGQVTKIQVKNSELFGSRFLNLQTFEEEQDHKEISDDFVDALSVDRYGFVFVDDAPKKNHQFEIGAEVMCSDDSLGKISSFTADRICVKIGDEERWMERDVAPTELKLIFPNQKDIGKYVFVLSVEEEKEAPNLFDSKEYIFSDIKHFEIPYSANRNTHYDVVSLGIYAKPRGTDIPLIKVKFIEYPPNDADENNISIPSFSNTDIKLAVNHLIVALKEMDSEIRDSGGFIDAFGLQFDDQSEWMQCITEHALLFDVTSYRRKLVIERLIVELNLLSAQWVRRITEQKKDGKPLLYWLVEDRKILRLLDHYQVMTSKFKILHFSSLMNRSWLRLEENSKMKEFAVVKSDNYLAGNEYKVNEQIFSTTTFSVEGQVTRVEVKNAKLFGDEFVNLQEFEEKQDRKETSTDFFDSLTVDHYGFVFVDDIPKRDHQFKIGDEVKYKGNSTGKICDLTADQICIKMGSERQWIKRSVIPMTITLIFPHQQDVGKYEFAVNAGHGNASMSGSDAKLFSFTDIKRFEVPYAAMRNKPYGVYSLGVYAKPKGMEVPLVRIKSIEYPPKGMADAVISNTESVVNHLIGTLKQTRNAITDQVAFLNIFGLNLDDQSKWMHLIIDHSLLFEETSYRKKLVIERLIVELNLLTDEWLYAMVNQKKQNKLLLEWLVEDRKVFRLLDYYRVITSKPKIEKYSKFLYCSWLSLKNNMKMKDTFGLKEDHDSLCFENTEFRVNGILISSTKQTIVGPATIMTVKNPDLFGDDEFILHRFEQKEEEKEIEEQQCFGDLLDINGDGVISVQLCVDRNLQIKVNGNWIKGTVSRLQRDKICVKVGENEDFLTFYWIYRYDIPSKIKLQPFENEKEISDFEFAARAGQNDDARDLPHLKGFTFGNVDEFQIQVKSINMSSSGTANAVHIYTRPTGTDFAYHHIKSLRYQFDKWCFRRYVVGQKDAFFINEIVGVKPSSKALQNEKQFEVVASTKIVISEFGGINAFEGIGQENDIKNNIKDSDYEGGSIYLFSRDGVVNRGTLICKGTGNKRVSAGRVSIIAAGAFENHGHIDAGKEGIVRIVCSRIVNEGRIISSPNVIIGTFNWQSESIRNLKDKMVKDVFIPIKISRGTITRSNWYYSSDVAAICVKVNRASYLTGIGIFDCKNGLEIECKIYEGDNGSKSGPVIHEEPRKTFKFHERSATPFDLLFWTPVLLRQDVKYTIEIVQKNYTDPSYRVTNARNTVKEEGLTVTFSDARQSPNGRTGTFPYLYLASI